MGVLYEQKGVTSRLTDFAARLGVVVEQRRARELYRAASRGRLTAAALWEALGIPGPDRDAEFLEGRTLMPGARAFLAEMRRAGVPVGCITNDVAEWSRLQRRAHGLEGDIGPWVVSGEVGVRKPAPEIFERFVAESGWQAGECLFVDDNVENLDGARSLGFQTVWFNVGPAAPGRGHLPLGSF